MGFVTLADSDNLLNGCQMEVNMLNLKDQVFGDAGFSSDLKLSVTELDTFRQFINAQWLQTVNDFYPDLAEEAKELGIENYHHLANKMDHKKIWPKSNRVLPKDAVLQIKKLPFLNVLRQEFGEFSLSDIYDKKQHIGHEEVYWRLVRPNETTDVGPLHKDRWFHGAFNNGYGMFQEDEVTIKIWIPIFCEPGKSGLCLLSGSHLKEWNYHIEVTDGIPRPVPDEDLLGLGATLIPTAPGNILLFHENVLHGGAVNSSASTRVSVEITMVLKLDPTNGIKKY
jgi:hypothetical protein